MTKMSIAKLLKGKLLLLTLLIGFSACSEQEVLLPADENRAVVPTTLADGDGIFTELPGFSFNEILEVFSNLLTAGVEAISPILEALDLPGDLASAALRTYKVSAKAPHPDGSGTLIDVSGVVIVPANYADSLRFVISPVPTYTENDAAPSIIFSGTRDVPLLYDNFLNYLYFTALNAFQGCAIFMPDYPGFGDSFEQCFHPYGVKKSLVESTLILANTAKQAILANGYLLKEEVIVTGYSQGGLVATAVAHELDTNPVYDMPLKILFGGGVPANLKAMIDIARGEFLLPLSFVFPYAIYGYQQNGYPDIIMSDLINPFYSWYTPLIFDGYHSVVDAIAAFPIVNELLFTQKVRDNDETNYSVKMLNDLLIANSVAPWKNTAPVVFLHGKEDEAVYYNNVKIFINEMEALGGTPELITIPLVEHVLAIFSYFIELADIIADNK